MRRLLEGHRESGPVLLVAVLAAVASLFLVGCLGTAPSPFEDEVVDPGETTASILTSGMYALSLQSIAENSCSDVNPELGVVLEVEVVVNENAVTLYIPAGGTTYTVASPIDGADFAGGFETVWDWNDNPAQPTDCTEGLYHYFSGHVTSETTFDLVYTLERSESAGTECASVPNALPCVEERVWAGGAM